MTEIYFRVQRDGLWETIEMEQLTNAERADVMANRGSQFILDCLNIACGALAKVEKATELPLRFD